MTSPSTLVSTSHFAVTARNASSFEGCTQTGDAVVCNFTRAGQKSVVAWAETGTAAYTAPEGSTLLCDPAAKCTQVAGGSAVTLTEIPVRIYLQA